MVVCLVLDEAHKATGKYAYTRVVQYLYNSNAKARVVSNFVVICIIRLFLALNQCVVT